MKHPQVSNFMQRWMWHNVISVALIATQKSRTDIRDIAADYSETAVEHRKYRGNLAVQSLLSLGETKLFYPICGCACK